MGKNGKRLMSVTCRCTAGRKKKKGDNQKGGDQNRYRPFTTSIT